MADYKADITLNERDSLIDMLSVEKTLVKLYSTALTEGVSKGFRNAIKGHWIETADDQLKVFLQLTENDYYRVHSADEEELSSLREQFEKTKHQLS
ncbi:MAG: spore coat protein [Clostridia bacterium]|nr:spore coat protein [Clostridia bacterium]